MSTETTRETTPQEEDETRHPGWRLIIRQLRRARRQFGWAMAATTLYGIATVASAFVVGWVSDSVLFPAAEAGNYEVATLAGAALVVLAVSAGRGLGIMGRRFGAYAAQFRLQQRDRVEVTDRYLELPIEWHRRHPAGQLLSNVNADVEAASQIAGPLPMAFGVTVMLVITAVLLIITDPFLAIVGFAIGPAIAITNVLFQRKMRIAAATAQKLRAEVTDIAHESFDAALVVKTLGRESDEVGRFGSVSDGLRDSMVEVGRLRAGFDPIMEALPTMSVLGVVLVGAWRLDQGLITAGTLITFAYLFRLIALPMRVFAWMLGQLPAATAGWDRIDFVLKEQDGVSYGVQKLTASGGVAATATDVEYLHPETVVGDLARKDETADEVSDVPRRGVGSITIDVQPGRTVALVGPTGSGKSTIAHLLVRLFDPDAGVIRLDGLGILDLDRDQLAQSAALVFQESFLFNETVAGNIALGGPYDAETITAAAQLAQAHDFIMELDDGYETVVGERGANLSGGQRQRIALARALIRSPRLLVLDDATSAVDPGVESAILAGLSQIDATVILVAYRRSSIVLADEVIYIDDGRIMGRGRHPRLYETLPGYRSLIDAYDVEASK